MENQIVYKQQHATALLLYFTDQSSFVIDQKISLKAYAAPSCCFGLYRFKFLLSGGGGKIR